MKDSDNKHENGEVREKDEESIDGKRYLSHIERTATEPRDESLHTLILRKITPMNATTRLFYLSPPPPSSTSNPPHQKQKLTWKPGQWVDLYLPGIEKPGGYSITNFLLFPTPNNSRTPTSTPTSPSDEEKPSPEKREAEEQGIELAIQRPIFKPEEEGKISEQVTWLFQNAEEILGTEVRVRIGGSFVWPPDSFASFTSSAAKVNGSTDLENTTGIKRIVFIAGGMGINPLISMVGYINSILEIHGENVGPENERERECYANLEIQFLYTTKTPPPFTNKGEAEAEAEAETEAQTLNSIPFLTRLTSIFSPSPSPSPSSSSPRPQPHPPRQNWNLQLFLTTPSPSPSPSSSPSPTLHPQIQTQSHIPIHTHRITPQTIQSTLSPTPNPQPPTLIYICGPPHMTDSIIQTASKTLDIDTDGKNERGRIFYERWW